MSSKAGIMTKLWAYCVLAYSKVATFITDCGFFVKEWLSQWFRLTAQVWKGWTFGSTFQCIKFTFGILIVSWTQAKQTLLRRQDMRLATMASNIKMGMPQGFFQQAKAYTVA